MASFKDLITSGIPDVLPEYPPSEPGINSAPARPNVLSTSERKKAVENAKKMDSLNAEDIANAILFAVESPQNVNVNEILIRPTSQER